MTLTPAAPGGRFILRLFGWEGNVSEGTFYGGVLFLVALFLAVVCVLIFVKPPKPVEASSDEVDDDPFTFP